MKTSFKYIAAALISGVAFLTSCSDVEIPEAANKDLGTVTSVSQNVDGRELTLTWSPVAGAVGYLVYCNGELVAQTTETTYTTLCPYETTFTYTIKYVDANGLVSLGQSIFVDAIPAPPKPVGGATMVGYLLTADNYNVLPDDDEVAAAQWFQENYVAKNEGTFVTLEQLAVLNPTDCPALWIHIDRVGIGMGYENLPFDAAALSAIHDYLRDGGNLYLSKHATQLVNGIGRIADNYAPGIFADGNGGSGDDVWCVNNVIGSGQATKYDHTAHAIFAGIELTDPNGYGFPNFPLEGPGLREDHNCMWDLNSYGFSGDPNVVANWEAVTTSTVLATWGHVQDYCCAGIVEFHGAGEYLGKIIANGLSAYEFNQEGGNVYQNNVNRLTANTLDYLRGAVSTKAAYVLTAGSIDELPDDDEVVAARWFKTTYVDAGKGTFVTPAQIAGLDINEYPVLWIQIDRIGIGIGYENLPFDSDALTALHNYMRDGGNLYLSKHATQLISGIARIGDNYAPGLFGDGNGGSGDDVWCVNNVIGSGQATKYDHTGHDIFAGIELTDPNGYGFPNFPLEGPGLREDHNCMWDLNAYGFTGDPNVVANWEKATNSTVLATWGHVQDYCCAGIIEFHPEGEFLGSAICNGLSAYEFNQEGGNAYQANVELLTKNTIDYLMK